MSYNRSSRHIANVLAARIKATEVQAKKKQDRVDQYTNNPSRCKCCHVALPYDRKNNKFCSRSCSAKVNNSTRSPEVLKKRNASTSKTFADRRARGATPKPAPERQKLCKVEFKQCKVCGKTFYTKTWSCPRATCSRPCQTQASMLARSYQNGSRKTFRYINPSTNETVTLESTWELKIAELLDSFSISWDRPDPIPWVDKEGTSRLYYPDFYLPAYDVYLDPKNPYCMSRDTDKLAYVGKIIRLVCGNLSHIQGYVESLG